MSKINGEKTNKKHIHFVHTIDGGQSTLWSAEQGKENKRKTGSGSPAVPDEDNLLLYKRSTLVAQLAPRNLLTRWDVSSIPANGIFKN